MKTAFRAVGQAFQTRLSKSGVPVVDGWQAHRQHFGDFAGMLPQMQHPDRRGALADFGTFIMADRLFQEGDFVIFHRKFDTGTLLREIYPSKIKLRYNIK
jgi:hypothetical protein